MLKISITRNNNIGIGATISAAPGFLLFLCSLVFVVFTNHQFDCVRLFGADVFYCRFAGIGGRDQVAAIFARQRIDNRIDGVG